MLRSTTKAACAAILTAALAAGCSSLEAETGGGAEGRWQATGIVGLGVIGPARTTFELAADGAVSGKGGCNGYFGTASLAGDAISFGPLGATQMACEPEIMDQETAYFAAMATVAHWRNENGQLVLLDETGAEAVRFDPVNESAAIVIDLPAGVPVETETVSYDCDGVALQVEYIDAGDVSLATLAIGDEFVVASRVLAASGARYSGGQYVWWAKGDEAMLIDYMNGGADAPVVCVAG